MRKCHDGLARAGCNHRHVMHVTSVGVCEIRSGGKIERKNANDGTGFFAATEGAIKQTLFIRALPPSHPMCVCLTLSVSVSDLQICEIGDP